MPGAWGINGATASAPFHITEAEQSKAGALPRGGGEAGRRKEGSNTPAGTDKLSKLHPLGGGRGKTETATTIVVNPQEQLTLDSLESVLECLAEQPLSHWTRRH